MYARIFSLRSATDRKFPRRNTRRANTLNQISTWFSHDVCFGTYTNRTRCDSSVREALRAPTNFSTPLFPFLPHRRGLNPAPALRPPPQRLRGVRRQVFRLEDQPRLRVRRHRPLDVV